MIAALLRTVAGSCFVPLILLPLSAARAQARPETPIPATQAEATPPTPAAPSTESTDKAPAPTDPGISAIAREAARFAEFDRLKTQGLTTDFPGAFETITRDAGGVRSWLYDHDLYFRGLSSNTLSYDVVGDNRSRRPQNYIGQRLTATQSNELRVSWKFGGSGEDITQLNVAGLFNLTSWRAIGPSGAKFSMLNVYSSFLDRRIEVKAGFGQNISEFVGIFAGGNPILASGLAASIPLSTGMSGGTTVSPSLNVQFNGKDGLYSKSAVQRSLIPQGPTEDAAGAGAGLKLTRRGARPLFIQEFGVRRAASADGRQIWLRAGGSYNLTDYARFDGSGERRNWSLYALADYQIVQPDARASYRGIYAGVSALFAPDAVNTYKRSLEARVYALGMIPGRPTDQMTFTIGRNSFSRTAGRLLEARGGRAHRSQFSAGALYAFHLTNGIFVSPSVNYIRNPSLLGDYRPALNFATSIALLF